MGGPFSPQDTSIQFLVGNGNTNAADSLAAALSSNPSSVLPPGTWGSVTVTGVQQVGRSGEVKALWRSAVTRLQRCVTHARPARLPLLLFGHPAQGVKVKHCSGIIRCPIFLCLQSEAIITVLASDLSSPSGGSKTPSALIGGLVGGGECERVLHARLLQP